MTRSARFPSAAGLEMISRHGLCQPCRRGGHIGGSIVVDDEHPVEKAVEIELAHGTRVAGGGEVRQSDTLAGGPETTSVLS